MTTPPDPIVRAIAENTHPSVPYPIVMAMAEHETNFTPSETGEAGEIGLLQIMPATAREWGYTGPLEGLYDPRVNVAVATKGLATLFDRLHTWPEAIRAYNGSGPAARAYSVAVIQKLPLWTEFVKANKAIFQAVTSKRALQLGLIVAAVLAAVFLFSARQSREAEA
jgi:soluble lytic murein transglycosylase-like protein